MIIADHHKPGGFMATDTDYVPACAWPEKCFVQWGGTGVVFGERSSYRTAFFEAFPGDNAGGFVRGEGATIAEAERNAYARYVRESACNHRWGRGSYLNGGAVCYGCKAFKMVFKPVHILGHWRRPISKMDDQFLDMEPATESGSRLQDRLRIRKRLFGVSDQWT